MKQKHRQTPMPQTPPPLAPVGSWDSGVNSWLDSFFRKSGATRHIAWALFFLALALRVISNANLFFAPVDAGYRNVEIFDSQYQMRRMEMTVMQYPRVPFQDTYHYFPDNPTIPWPPGFTFFLASVAKPFDLLSGGSRLVRETVVGLIPPVTDAVNVVLFFLLFAQVFSLPLAFVAAALLAVSPQNAGFSEIGYVDHHVFINFLVALFGWFYWRYHQKPTLGRAAVLGCVLGGSVFFNVSVVQYALLALMSLGAWPWVSRHGPEERQTMWMVYVGAVIGSAVSAFTTPVGMAGQIRYDQTSWFQPLLMVGMAMTYGMVWLWRIPQDELIPQRLVFWRSWRWPLLALGGLVLVGLAGFVARDVGAGAQFLLLGNKLNYIQGEEASVRVYFSTWPNLFTWSVFLVPIGLFSLWRRRRDQPEFLVLAGLLFAHGLLSGLAHSLYIQYLFPWYALVVAAGARAVWQWATPPWPAFRWTVLAPIALQVLFVLVQTFLIKDDFQLKDRKAIRLTIQALAWLREHTPPTSHFDFGDGAPEYSVWAHRDLGHQIVRIAHRPVVVSPFSTPDFFGHMRDYARSYYMKKEEDYFALLEQYRARYVLLDYRDNVMQKFLVDLVDEGPEKKNIMSGPILEPYLFRNNLLFFDGELRWRKNPPVKHFRLVYEVPYLVPLPLQTPQGVMKLSYNGLKIFERVAGAVVKGENFFPGERVIFRLPLRTGTGREWVYTSYALADKYGRLTVTLPYPSHALRGSSVVPLAPAYLVDHPSGHPEWLAVGEEDVAEGRELTFKATLVYGPGYLKKGMAVLNQTLPVQLSDEGSTPTPEKDPTRR